MNADNATDLATRELDEAKLRVALKALEARVIRVVALLLAFGLATFTVIQPSWPGAAASGVFTLLALLSTWRKGGAA